MQSKKIGLVAGILIALCAPLVSLADVVSISYLGSRFTMGDAMGYGTSSMLYPQNSTSAYAITQTLPPNLSGPIGAFVVGAGAGDWYCTLDRDVVGGQWIDANPLSNGLQVMCDFSDENISFVASSTYHLNFYSESSSPLVFYGSEASTGVYVEGYDGQPVLYQLPDATLYVEGHVTSSPIVKTLKVTFSSNVASSTYAYDFEAALGQSIQCDSYDVFCQFKAFTYNLIVPSGTVRDDLDWNTSSFHTAFPFAIFYAVSDSFSLLSSLTTATTTGETVNVPIYAGAGTTTLVIPSIASAVAPASGVFSSIRSWILILLKIFVVVWTFRLLLSIVGIGGSVGSGGRLLHSSVGGQFIRHTRNWN